MYSVIQQPGSSTAPAAELLATLARAHNFSHAALAANRAGHLAPEQIATLRRRAWRKLLPGSLVVGGALLLAAAVGIAEGRQILAQMLLFSAIIALGGGRLIAIGLKGLSDARSGAVVTLEGIVVKTRSVDTDESGNSTLMYYYHVGQQQFRVSAAAYTALPSGVACRLYHSPIGKELLSIEPALAPDAWRSLNY